LADFYRNRSEKLKNGRLLADIERERIFDGEDACEELIDDLVDCYARGVLKALYHNAYNFLTSCDGKYATEKWDAILIEKTKHCVADNIFWWDRFSEE
jgi:hypothetical protein